MILISNTVAISRDYQDSWILEGLEISFAFFVTMYSLAFFSENRSLHLVVLAVLGACVFLLVPNLKYVWFLGKYIDQHQQYGMASHVCRTGYIPTEGPHFVGNYAGTPFIHLIFAIFSIVSYMPVVDSLKYLPVFLYPIYPLLTYVLVKRVKFLKGTSTMKYALFLSSIPISPEKYCVTGSQFGVLLTFFALSSLVILSEEKDRNRWFVFILIVSVLAATHASSSILLTTYLLTMMLIAKFPHLRLKSYLKVSSVVAVATICIAWLMFPASFTFEEVLRTLGGASTGLTTVGALPTRFFELARINVVEATKIVLVLQGTEAIFLLLSLGGLLVSFKMLKRPNGIWKLLFLAGVVMMAFIPIGFLIKVGGFRIVHLASPLFPILCGILVMHVVKRKTWIGAAMLFSILLLATLRFYACEPLVPSASVISGDLPAGEPIVYVNDVNTIYQRCVVEFASNYIDGRIAGDSVTRNQVVGLTDFNFSASHVVRYYPLDRSRQEIEYSYFVTHLPGKSGGFEEAAELRTRDLVLEAIYELSIIYTNSESYILAHSR